MKVYVFIALAVLMSFCSEHKGLTNLSVQQFHDKLHDNDSKLLIDVRTFKEFSESHIEGAINVDFWAATFVTDLEYVDRDSQILVYCMAGGRSAKAANKMRELGFKNVYNLTGGISEWQAAGKSVNKNH